MTAWGQTLLAFVFCLSGISGGYAPPTAKELAAAPTAMGYSRSMPRGLTQKEKSHWLRTTPQVKVLERWHEPPDPQRVARTYAELLR